MLGLAGHRPKSDTLRPDFVREQGSPKSGHNSTQMLYHAAKTPRSNYCDRCASYGSWSPDAVL